MTASSERRAIARLAGAVLRLPLRLVRYLLLLLLELATVVLACGAVGAALGLAVGLAAAPWHGWEAVAIGAGGGFVVAGYLGSGLLTGDPDGPESTWAFWKRVALDRRVSRS